SAVPVDGDHRSLGPAEWRTFDVLNARIVVEPVEHVQKRGSDDSEYVLDALDLQHLDDGSSARPGIHVRGPPRGATGTSRRATEYGVPPRKQGGGWRRRTEQNIRQGGGS